MTLSVPNPEDVLSSDACWALLERVATSSQMKKAGRLRNLLLYVGRRSLKEGCPEIREKEIGVEVFGRLDTYDTSVDNIVRSSVSELRKRVSEYFRTEGLKEPVMMEIPRGSYVPVFRLRPIEPPSIAESSISAVSNLPKNPQELAAVETKPLSRSRTAMRWGILVLSVACVILLIGCVSLWILNRKLEQQVYPWRNQPSVASFWSRFIDNPKETDIVLPDPTFRRLQRVTRESFSLQEYLSGTYLKELEDRYPDPEMHKMFDVLSSKDLSTKSELNLAQSILALDPYSTKLHLYHARDYLPDFLQKNNVILIGSQFGNPWDQLFLGQLNFIAKDDFSSPDSSPVIINRAPAANEQPIYKPTESLAYCTVAYFPNPGSNGTVLLIEGAGTGSLQAARDFLFSDTQLSSFRKLLHVDKFPYFEALIKVVIVKGTPVNETIVSYRVFSNGPR